MFIKNTIYRFFIEFHRHKVLEFNNGRTALCTALIIKPTVQNYKPDTFPVYNE